MKKIKTLIITSMLVILTLIVALLSGCAEKANYAEADLNFDGLAEAPTQEAMAKAIPVDKTKISLSDTDTTDQAVLDSIEYIIRLANQNLIDCDFFAGGAYGSGVAQMVIAGEPIVGSMQTRDIRIFDNNTYYFDTYGLVVDGYILNKNGQRGKDVNEATFTILAKALNFTKRVYSPNNQDFYFSKNGKSNQDSLLKFPDQNAIVFNNPKSTKMSYDEYMKMTYSRFSYKGFTSDDYDTKKPITAGLLKYDAETGIYYLEAEINCNDETLKYSNDDMLENGAINKFRYAQKRVKIEIWECGLIRTYINKNRWEATILGTIKGSSDNIYEQWFSYDKSKLDKMNIDQSLKDALMK
ncbi:MAG: hypothetical protein K2I46_04860 [Clostridia bacterium]|nr:hypothetical protein [Clostridia bacterium]